MKNTSGMAENNNILISKLEKKIQDGLKPPCPLCGSDLHIGEKQKGESGAFGYSYRCTNSACELRPEFVHVVWHQVLVKALQQKVFQMALVIISSITIVGLGGKSLGFISFSNEIEQDSSALTDNEFNSEQIMILKQELEEKENELESIKNSANNSFSSQQMLDLATYYAQNTEGSTTQKRDWKSSRDLLFNLAEKYSKQLNGTQESEIVATLLRLRTDIHETAEFDTLIKIVDKLSPANNRNINLFIAYWAYADADNKNYLNWKVKSFEYYLAAIAKGHFYSERNTSDALSLLTFIQRQGRLPFWKETDIEQLKNAIKLGDTNQVNDFYLIMINQK